MTKNFYEILEIDKSASEEQIKKAYRKLSLKWHPDKWASKSESEKQQAEEKFKEINKAYQILSDSTTRNLYDIYGEEFEKSSSGGDASSATDEIRREYAKAEAEKLELKKQMLTLQMRSHSITLIIYEFLEFIWITEDDLDASLWTPYKNWKEKIKNLSFEEIDTFREQMISAIQKVGKSKKDEENEEKSSNSVKKDIIREIENLLKKKNIKLEELEPINRNYKEVINNAGETMSEIVAVEERIKSDINIKHIRKSEPNNNNHRDEGGKDNWTKTKTWWPGKNLGKDKGQLEEEIKEIQILVDYLKEEQSKNPSQSNKDKLKEAEGKLKDLKKAFQYSPSSQPFLSPLIIGGVVLVLVIGIGFLIYKSKKRNKKLR